MSSLYYTEDNDIEAVRSERQKPSEMLRHSGDEEISALKSRKYMFET